eukprot:scaffold167534_cov33-Tisochrysis_lutea.AAC.3
MHAASMEAYHAPNVPGDVWRCKWFCDSSSDGYKKSFFTPSLPLAGFPCESPAFHFRKVRPLYCGIHAFIARGRAVCLSDALWSVAREAFTASGMSLVSGLHCATSISFMRLAIQLIGLYGMLSIDRSGSIGWGGVGRP